MTNQKSDRRFFWWLLIFLAAGLAAVFLPPLLTLTLVIAVFVIFFLMRYLDFGLVILVFFFPYLGLVIDLSKVEALRDVPFLNQLNAPFVDIFAVVLFVAWLLYVGMRVYQTYQTNRKIQLRALVRLFPHLKSFLPFFASAVVSLVNVSSRYFLGSVKYLARPIAFFYLAFFVPTVSIIKKYGENFLIQIFGVLYVTGLISAFIGLISFFVVPVTGFPRATPFAFGQIAPLGFNHNLLAETLIATAPAGFLLWFLRNHTDRHGLGTDGRGLQRGKWLLAGSVLQVAIALLTFARTAWIALAVQFTLFLILEYRTRIKLLLQRAVPALAVVIPLIGYMIWTMGTEVVRGSTLSRLDMIRVAWFYFLKEPLIGNGVGTFIPSLWGVKAFLLEYGEPLEAHGIIWKLIFEQGVFGLLTFGIFVGAILFTIARALKGKIGKARVVILTSLIIVVGSFAYQLFNTTYYTSKLWVPVGVAIAAVSLYNKSDRTDKSNKF